MIDRNTCQSYIRGFQACRQEIPKAPTSHVVKQIAEKVANLIFKARSEQPEFAQYIWDFKLACEEAVSWKDNIPKNDNTIKQLFQTRLADTIDSLVEASEEFLQKYISFPSSPTPGVSHVSGGATGPTSSASHSYAPTGGPSLSVPALADDLSGAEAEIRKLQNQIHTLNYEKRQLSEEMERRTSKYNELANGYNQLLRKLESQATQTTIADRNLQRRLEEEQNWPYGRTEDYGRNRPNVEALQNRVDHENARANNAERDREAFRRQVQAVESEREALRGQVHTVESEREFFKRQVAELKTMQWGAVALQSHLQNSMEAYPASFRDFAQEVLKLAEQIGNAEYRALPTRQEIERLDLYIYRPPLVNGWLAQEQVNPVKLEDLLRVISLQDWVHRSLQQQGLAVIRPATGDGFDPNAHNFTEQDLVWINNDRSLNNKIASVKRIGYMLGETVIRKADVKRYVFSEAGVTSQQTTTENLEPLENLQKEMQAYLTSNGITVIDPSHGEEFDENYHDFTEQEPISAEKRELDKKIASVNRVGYMQGETVLRKAEVKRYCVVEEPLRQPSPPDALDTESVGLDEGNANDPTRSEIKRDSDISSDPTLLTPDTEVTPPVMETRVQEPLQAEAPTSDGTVDTADSVNTATPELHEGDSGTPTVLPEQPFVEPPTEQEHGSPSPEPEEVPVMPPIITPEADSDKSKTPKVQEPKPLQEPLQETAPPKSEADLLAEMFG